MDMKMLLWKWPMGGLWLLRKRGKSLTIYIFHQEARGECENAGKRITKTSQSIKEIQAIFLEPIPISQDFDNVIHYVKYPKHTQ